MRDIINKINEIESKSPKTDELMLSEEDAAILADANLVYAKVASLEIAADMTDAEIEGAVGKLIESFWKDGR